MIRPKIFSNKLLAWSQTHPRMYPWTGEKDPYKIWISEIILQQTRSEQGKIYYEKFITRYPDIKNLAIATEDEIMNDWKGLGYYSRARNLHKAAKTIYYQYDGIFPNQLDVIKSLKGIGEYSAAAISSFAFNVPAAVVDGNVIRILSRVLGLSYLFKTAQGKRNYFELANKYLNKEAPALYNQAIMNFGAIQCKPQKPNCPDCIFSKSCYAFLNNLVHKLPVKSKKNILKKRYFHYFVMKEKSGKIALQKRTKKDIWQQLYELPLIETDKNIAFHHISQVSNATNLFKFETNSKLCLEDKFKQKLSHQEINSYFYTIQFGKISSKIKHKFYFVKPENLVNFAFPKIISAFLEKFNSK